MKFREIPLINKPATEEVISITRSGIGFSSKFIVNQKLEAMESVSFGTIETDPFVLAFKFYEQVGARNSLQLLTQGRGNYTSNGRTVKARELFSKAPILQKLAEEKEKLEVHFDKFEKFFFVRLRPVFESSCLFSARNKIPDDASGIYRYLNMTGDIVYIGKGVIKARAGCQERRDWDVKTIEYSEINDDDESYRWEAHYLEDFRLVNGSLPRYNRVPGHTSKLASLK